MVCKIYYSPEAVNDLDEIYEYIQTELCNPPAALNVVNNILDIIDQLKDFPDMGARLSDAIDVETEYRFVISGNYMRFTGILTQRFMLIVSFMEGGTICAYFLMTACESAKGRGTAALIT